MARYKYTNVFTTSYTDDATAEIRKRANQLRISTQDVIRMAVNKYIEQTATPETPIEKTNNGNEQNKRNDGKREHLYQ